MLGGDWVGWAIGVIAVGVAFYFGMREGGARLVYLVRGTRLIGARGAELPPAVAVLYKGRPVPRMSGTEIVIWNRGRAPVRGNDISSHDPLRFEFAVDTEVLEVAVLKVSRPATTISVTVDPKTPNTVLCHFDFLDAQDGAVLYFLHTDETIAPKPVGTVVGVPRGLEWFRPRTVDGGWLRPSTPRGFTSYFGGAAGLLRLGTVAVFGLVATLTSELLRRLDSAAPAATSPIRAAVLVAVGLLALLLMGTYGFLTRRPYPKSIEPD